MLGQTHQSSSFKTHLLSGCVLATAAAVAIATSVRAFGRISLLNSDGQHFYAVALRLTDLRDAGGEIASYRIGRPLLSVLAWLGALGQSRFMLAALTGVFIASVLVVGFAASRTAERPYPVWFLLACPAFWFTVPHLVAEPLVVALVLIAYVVAGKGKLAAPVVGALAMLAKESAAPALFPLFFRAVRERDGKVAAAWVAAGAPLTIWWVLIRVWTGVWPWQDGPGPGDGALSLPFVGMIEAIPRQAELAATAGSRAMPWLIVSILLGAGTFAISVVGWHRDRSSLLWQAALWSALLLVTASLSTWAHPGEAIRLMYPAQMFAMLAWHRGRSARTASP